MNRVLVIDTCSFINLMHIKRFGLLNNLKYSALTTIFVELEFEDGHEDSREFFRSLISSKSIQLMPLQIEDLIQMANVPESKRASDAELSCFVVAQRLGCQAMTDDKNAVRFLRNHLRFDWSDVLGLVHLLLEAYQNYLLGDEDLRSIQKTLKANKFHIKFDLACEAARRRLLSSPGTYFQQ
jgi:predicted nucleic acid-binding protein